MDRISNLPVNVIDDILKHLSLRDAVRTSILSKQWRYKWTAIPYLVFDWNFTRKLLAAKYDIVSIVNQVLLRHKGPIIKFTFEIGYGLNNCRSAVDHWLHFLANHCNDSIEELKLVFPSSAIQETLPGHLFSLHKLKSLWLHHCTLRPPSEFQGFGRLDSIVLVNVLTEPGNFTSFISKCPMLRTLCLHNNIIPNMSRDLEIDAPNLETFLYRFMDRFPSICIKRAVLLDKVSFIQASESSSLETSQRSQSNLIEFFRQLSSIKRLRLDYNLLQLFARGGVATKFPSKFRNLMILDLSSIDFGEIDHVSCVVCLIGRFPNLQSLKIESNHCHAGNVKPIVEFLKEQQNNKLTHYHLKNVKIDSFSGSEPEMEFVKLILSAASALTKLEVNCDLKDAEKEESRMLKVLARFRRASTKAEIIIN